MAPATLGQLFQYCDALPLETRMRLASILAVPGQRVPLLNGDFLDLPLPGASEPMQAVLAALTSGLGPHVLAALGGHRLDDVIPALVHAPGGPLTGAYPSRLVLVLKADGVATWAELGARTVAHLSGLHGVGPRTMATVLSGALAAAIQHPRRIQTAALALGAPGDGDGGGAPILGELTRVLTAAGEARDRIVFERLVLATDGAPNLAGLAAMLDIGSERIRRLRARAVQRVRDAASAESAGKELHLAVDDVAGRLGRAAPVAAAERVLDDLGLPGVGDIRSRLLLWLAGPYETVADHPGWLGVSMRELASETSRALGADGGVRMMDHAREDLAALGLHDDHAKAWLREQRVRVVDELVVALTGSDVDVAERALSAVGHAMATTDLSGWCANAGMAMVAALSRDRRFVRVGEDAWELSEWGSLAYNADADADADADGDGDGDAGRRGDALSLHIDVDESVLSGGSGMVPDVLADGLGMVRGSRRAFSTRYGPLALSYDGANATRGSIRPIALAVGALAGDALVIGFQPDGNGASVELLPSSAIVDALFSNP